MIPAFTNKRARAIIDSLLLLCIPLAFILTNSSVILENDGFSSHCFIGLTGYSLMWIHTLQHFRFIKALPNKSLWRRNKLTTLLVICFFVLSLSFLAILLGSQSLLWVLHNHVGHFFGLILLLHILQKLKRFVAFF